MLKHEIKNDKEDNICFICKKKFEDGDDVVTIFDKAFGCTVKIHKHHHFEEENG